MQSLSISPCCKSNCHTKVQDCYGKYKIATESTKPKCRHVLWWNWPVPRTCPFPSYSPPRVPSPSSRTSSHSPWLRSCAWPRMHCSKSHLGKESSHPKITFFSQFFTSPDDLGDGFWWREISAHKCGTYSWRLIAHLVISTFEAFKNFSEKVKLLKPVVDKLDHSWLPMTSSIVVQVNSMPLEMWQPDSYLMKCQLLDPHDNLKCWNVNFWFPMITSAAFDSPW